MMRRKAALLLATILAAAGLGQLGAAPVGAQVDTAAYLLLNPGSSVVAAGGSQSFTAEAFDASGVDLGDATAATLFTISPDGSCTFNMCTPASPGPHTVTGIDGVATGIAAVTVPGPLASLVLSPPSATLSPGASETFFAEGFDAWGDDLGDVTAATSFAIGPDGSCTLNVCTATVAGNHAVTGTDGVAIGSTTLTVPLGRFVELIFSRTDVTAADGTPCQPDDTNVARLDTSVEPFLQFFGLAATGSLETGRTPATGTWCSHFGETESASWSVAQSLAAEGWTFVSHSMDYPDEQQWQQMSAAQRWQETCGSAQTIDANGLPGGDTMFLWPNNIIDPATLISDVEPCFGTNRKYGDGVTDVSAVAGAPYRQSVLGLSGGRCNTPGAPCDHVPGTITRYRTPADVINEINSLGPGQVLTLQSYLNVVGTSPAYTTSGEQWDCSSSDPTLHWTNDAERYCWSDLQTILLYLAASGIGISQPSLVEANFGRTGYSDQAVPEPG
jgi:hypothetical protein